MRRKPFLPKTRKRRRLFLRGKPPAPAAAKLAMLASGKLPGPAAVLRRSGAALRATACGPSQ
jgi:hypothetical protein